MNTVTTMNTAVKTASVSLVVDNTKPLTMSSRQIAEFTGKEHHKVKVDITKMLNALGYEDHAKFRVIYFDQYGREQNEYQLDEEMTLTLVTGYDVKRRMVVIQEWKRLKEENEKLRSQQVNPYANMTKLDWIREAMELEAANEQLIQEKEQLVDLHIRKAIDAHSLSRLLGEKRGSTKGPDQRC
ncbi:Rha family transcriptional regulator [Escherichia coli]|uniref:Rha family transcriptional regulator n=1 Tax=Escherichia coli TaxID=562 RepID=UPI0006A54FF2|nr:Rha family transcriptional regulator [Escherichia coli]CTZ97690.1 DNA-binding protein [Escherichia coli]